MRGCLEAKTFTTQGMKTETAVQHILGKAGTKVRLTVQREGASQPLEFELRRGLVEVETVLGAKRNDDDSWEYYIDPANKIGYIQPTQFAPGSYRDMEDAMKKLAKTGHQRAGSRPAERPGRVAHERCADFRHVHRRRPDCHDPPACRSGTADRR